MAHKVMPSGCIEVAKQTSAAKHSEAETVGWFGKLDRSSRCPELFELPCGNQQREIKQPAFLREEAEPSVSHPGLQRAIKKGTY